MKTRINIGRSPQADFVVPAEFTKVSGSHMIVEQYDGNYRIMDLGSRNGTQLNGIKINQNQFYQVKPYDQIILGKQYQLKWDDLLMVFRDESASKAEQQSEVPESSSGQEKDYSYDYAGFWVRFAANFFDGFLILLSIIVIETIFGLNLRAVIQHGNFYGYYRETIINSIVFLTIKTIILYVVIPYLYFSFMESGVHQATLGKRLMGLIVTDDNLQAISFGHATGRHFAKIISLVPFFYGFIMAGAHPEKKALHDIVAGTRIIRIKKNLRFEG